MQIMFVRFLRVPTLEKIIFSQKKRDIHYQCLFILSSLLNTLLSTQKFIVCLDQHTTTYCFPIASVTWINFEVISWWHDYLNPTWSVSKRISRIPMIYIINERSHKSHMQKQFSSSHMIAFTHTVFIHIPLLGVRSEAFLRSLTWLRQFHYFNFLSMFSIMQKQTDFHRLRNHFSRRIASRETRTILETPHPE